MKYIGNSLLAFLMVFLFTLHLFQVVVLTFPVPKMIERSVGHPVDFVALNQVPEHVRQVFSVPSGYIAQLPMNEGSIFDRALMKSFELRSNKIFDRADEQEFYLNTLSFGGDVIGIEDASKYYFSKPIQALDFEQGLTLLSFQRVFHNNN
jgi:hypothetical protein